MRFESSVLSVIYPIGDHGVLCGLLSVMPLCLLRKRVAPLSVACLSVAPLRSAPLSVAPLRIWMNWWVAPELVEFEWK